MLYKNRRKVNHLEETCLTICKKKLDSGFSKRFRKKDLFLHLRS